MTGSDMIYINRGFTLYTRVLFLVAKEIKQGHRSGDPSELEACATGASV